MSRTPSTLKKVFLTSAKLIPLGVPRRKKQHISIHKNMQNQVYFSAGKKSLLNVSINMIKEKNRLRSGQISILIRSS